MKRVSYLVRHLGKHLVLHVGVNREWVLILI